MESTELKDKDFISNPFTSFPDQSFFTPATSSQRFDKPDSQKAQYEDDDEYITELTRQMTNYMLQDDEKHQKSSGGGGSGSPQSTLWSPFASGYSSPIAPSREPSPPLTPTVEKFMNKIDTKPVTIPFQSKQALIDDQIRYIQANFHKIKKEKEREKKRNDDVLANKARNYHQSQRPKAGVKAVFVDGSGSRTVSGGTGVFLPRSHGTVVESRKKSGCSTVMVPARVVEALKIHFDKVGVPSTFSSDIPPFHDALLVSVKNKSIKSNSSSRPAQSGSQYVAEMSAKSQKESATQNLPQEWTY